MTAHTPLSRAISHRNVGEPDKAYDVLKNYFRDADWKTIKNNSIVREGLICTHIDWQIAVGILINIGQLKTASQCINEQFSTTRIKLEICQTLHPATILLEFFKREIIIHLSDKVTTPIFWFAGLRAINMLPLFTFVAQHITTDGAIVVGLGDNAHDRELSFCNCREGAPLIPDVSFMGSFGYARERDIFSAYPTPWERRRPAAFWRGSTTGNRRPDWRSLPRVKLCQLAAAHPQLLDCYITSVVQEVAPNEATEVLSAGLLGNYVDSVFFDQYRYHIDIDGNTNSWPGLFTKLLSGSPVLKFSSAEGYSQWYYDRLKPWYNFVPVTDLDDLLDKTKWLQAHDDRARMIGDAGGRLASSMTLRNEAEWTLALMERLIRNC